MSEICVPVVKFFCYFYSVEVLDTMRLGQKWLSSTTNSIDSEDAKLVEAVGLFLHFRSCMAGCMASCVGVSGVGELFYRMNMWNVKHIFVTTVWLHVCMFVCRVRLRAVVVGV